MYQIHFILECHSTRFGWSFCPSSGAQDCTYGNRHLSNRYCCLLASKQTDCPKHVEWHSKIKRIWHIGASCWFYYRNNITIHGCMNVQLFWILLCSLQVGGNKWTINDAFMLQRICAESQVKWHILRYGTISSSVFNIIAHQNVSHLLFIVLPGSGT